MLLTSLAVGSSLPDEVVVVVMEDEKYGRLPKLPFPVRQHLLLSDELPLASARNLAALKARNDYFVFLDVDCIPSRHLLASYEAALNEKPGDVFQGEVFYLPSHDLSQYSVEDRENHLRELGVRHPSKRPFPEQGYEQENDFGELWGLSFALHRDSFDSVGGFDESFVGYGGEETDFARALEDTGRALYRTANAAAFHQHHLVCIPPLHHFEAIVRNATIYHRKWNRWCMDYWLSQFNQSGFISWREEAKKIEVLRTPSLQEITDSHQPDTVRFQLNENRPTVPPSTTCSAPDRRRHRAHHCLSLRRMARPRP